MWAPMLLGARARTFGGRVTRVQPTGSWRKGGAPLPRVLVVDDDASHARVVAIGLRVEGFDVELTHNADEALRLLAGAPFDAAVVDLMLPGTNGIQLARLVREQHPRTRVILMSAYHLSERQLLRADCGAVGFVPKPFDLGELARFLRAKLASVDPDHPFATPGAAA
jgi:DNA-binding response OmpR family regulator